MRSWGSDRLYETVGLAEYVKSLLSIAAVLILLYADGVVRDRYHGFLDGMALRQSLCVLVLFVLLLLAGKRLSGWEQMKRLLLAMFVPLFLFAAATIASNAAAVLQIAAGTPIP